VISFTGLYGQIFVQCRCGEILTRLHIELNTNCRPLLYRVPPLIMTL
jgi:hypothetical protein